MKKHLALSEIKLSISETRPINPIFVEPDNLRHLLQLATEILTLINRWVDTKAKEHTIVLDQFKEASQTTLPETLISTIEKIQRFYLNPFTLRVNGNPYSSIISPYKLTSVASVISYVCFLGYFFATATTKLPEDFIINLPGNNQTYKNFKKNFYEAEWTSPKGTLELSLFFLDILSLAPSFFHLGSSTFKYSPGQTFLVNTFISFSYFLLIGLHICTDPKIPFFLLNPVKTYPTLSRQFDQLIQEMGNSNLKSDFYSPDLSIETYCYYSSIAVTSLISCMVLDMFNSNEILHVIKQVLCLMSKKEPPITKLQTEKEKIETEIQSQLTQWLEPVKKLHLSKTEEDTLVLDIKKQAILNIIETLETTIPRRTSTFSQRSDSRLKLAMNLLLQKIKDEKITEQDSNETIEQKFSNIQTILKDPIFFEIPLFPILHLEAHENLLGLRELTTINIQETRIPKVDHFQETVSDKNNLNRLIKTLIKGEVGSINNRDATSTSHDPDRQAYDIQFLKELFPSLLYFKTILALVETIQAFQDLSLTLTALTSPSAIEILDNLRLPSTPSEAQLEPENVPAGVV